MSAFEPAGKPNGPEFYVIGTYKNGGEIHDLRHEAAHALFSVNPEYKAEVLGALGQLDAQAAARPSGV